MQPQLTQINQANNISDNLLVSSFNSTSRNPEIQKHSRVFDLILSRKIEDEASLKKNFEMRSQTDTLEKSEQTITTEYKNQDLEKSDYVNETVQKFQVNEKEISKTQTAEKGNLTTEKTIKKADSKINTSGKSQKTVPSEKPAGSVNLSNEELNSISAQLQNLINKIAAGTLNENDQKELIEIENKLTAGKSGINQQLFQSLKAVIGGLKEIAFQQVNQQKNIQHKLKDFSSALKEINNSKEASIKISSDSELKSEASVKKNQINVNIRNEIKGNAQSNANSMVQNQTEAQPEAAAKSEILTSKFAAGIQEQKKPGVDKEASTGMTRIDSKKIQTYVKTSEITHVEKNFDTELLNKITKHISVSIKENTKKITLRLKPEYLGKLKISIEKQGNEFTGKMIVENSAIKEMLESKMQNLKDHLWQQGYDFNEFSIEYENQSSNTSEGFNLNQNLNAEQDNHTGTSAGTAFESQSEVNEIDIRSLGKKLNLIA